MSTASLDDFRRLDIRAGTVIHAEYAKGILGHAIWMSIDFGAELGCKWSWAQIAGLYQPEWLKGRQVLAVLNLPPVSVGKQVSEVMVLGLDSPDGGITLAGPDHRVPDGARLG